MTNVLITGAAGGIGASLCEVFQKKQYKVLGVDKKEIPPDKQYGSLCFDISCLGDPGEGEHFVKEVDAFFEGGLDVIVNNAAVQVLKPIEEVRPEDWKTTLDTNLLAPYWLIQCFLGQLKKNKGSIINIASIHANLTKAGFSIYATSKGAMVAMTRALALELAPDVRINAVIPAATNTPMLRAGFKNNEKGLKELGSYHPLGRIAEPEEIANVALFLASPQSSFITGSALNVDGGIGAVLHDPVVAR